MNYTSPRTKHLTKCARTVAIIGTLAMALSGCSLFGGADDGVFAIEPGQCFAAPAETTAQIADLEELDCAEPHDMESYAVVTYTGLGAEEGTFPGDEALKNFAEGTCAREFTDYVGVSYLDSDLFFTYLLPSARSWQDEDREVLCFVIDSGRPMTGSVKGAKS